MGNTSSTKQTRAGRLAQTLRAYWTSPSVTDVFELGCTTGAVTVVDLRTGESLTRPDRKWGRAVQDLRARLGLELEQVVVRNLRPEGASS